MSNEYRHVELLTGDVRRRRWTTEQKLTIIEQSFEPGETVSSTARRHGVAPNLLYRWRRLLSKMLQPPVRTASVSEYGFAWSQVSWIPRIHRNAPQVTTAMISKSDIELRVNNMTPAVNEELKSKLYNLQRQPLPFHPLILVFSTGCISVEDCLPMAREPMPAVGTPFSDNIASAFESAVQLNPSIHDGAVIFSRYSNDREYQLCAWSMRIVSNRIPAYAEPNVGSAHNSALALSLAPNVDLCAILSKGASVLFERGSISRRGE